MEYTKGEWKIASIGGAISPHGYNITADNGEFIGRIRLLANAQLIASAPDLYEACKAQHNAIDTLFAMLIERDKTFFPSKSGQPWEAIRQGNQAIAKVEDK